MFSYVSFVDVAIKNTYSASRHFNSRFARYFFGNEQHFTNILQILRFWSKLLDDSGSESLDSRSEPLVSVDEAMLTFSWEVKISRPPITCVASTLQLVLACFRWLSNHFVSNTV